MCVPGCLSAHSLAPTRAAEPLFGYPATKLWVRPYCSCICICSCICTSCPVVSHSSTCLAWPAWIWMRWHAGTLARESRLEARVVRFIQPLLHHAKLRGCWANFQQQRLMSSAPSSHNRSPQKHPTHFRSGCVPVQFSPSQLPSTWKFRATRFSEINILDCFCHESNRQHLSASILLHDSYQTPQERRGHRHQLPVFSHS